MRRLFLPFLGVAALSSLSAQAPTIPPPAPVIPTPAPRGPAAVAAPSPANEEQVSVTYPNNPVADILTVYERLTHKILIRDANLAGPNLSIVAAQPVPKSEAIRLIEAALLLNGYSLVPDGENQVKVLNSTGGKSPRSEGVPLYANPSSVPAGNEVISYFMQFRFLASADAQNIFQQHVVLHPGYGSIAQVPNAQALIITENASLIRQLINLQELIDVPPARVISEFVTLQRADADRVAEVITKLIDAQKNDKEKRGGSAPPAPAAPQGNPAAAAAAGAGGQLFENDLVSGSVQLVPDPRTNRILVITRPVNFPYIKSLIEEFDQSVGLSAPLERPLKYISASEVLPVLQDILTENEKEGGQGSSASTGKSSSSQQNRPSTTQGTSSNTGYNSGGSGSQTGANSHPDVLNEPEGDTGPTSVIVGKTRLIADNKANAILVIGPPESQDKVKTILDSLDRRPPQVYLSTVIGQLKLLRDNEFGIDYLKLFQSNGTIASHATGIAGSAMNSIGGSSLVDPRTLTSAAAFPAASGLMLYGTIGKSISVYVRALESTNRFKVLARPVVYTANNKKAVISSGQRVAYPTSTLSNLDTVNNNNNTAAVASNIDYEDVVLKLEVVPLINANNEVNLKIAQVDDSIAGSQTIAGNTVPTISTQSVNTTVTVPNGCTVALGGLITETTSKDTNGIPVLSHLPWVGPLFRDTKTSKERDELIILIQPTVVNSDSDILAASKSEKDRARVGPDSFQYAEPPLPEAAAQPFFPKQQAGFNK